MPRKVGSSWDSGPPWWDPAVTVPTAPPKLILLSEVCGTGEIYGSWGLDTTVRGRWQCAGTKAAFPCRKLSDLASVNVMMYVVETIFSKSRCRHHTGTSKVGINTGILPACHMLYYCVDVINTGNLQAACRYYRHAGNVVMKFCISTGAAPWIFASGGKLVQRRTKDFH